MLAIAMLSHEQDKLIKLSAPGHELWTPRTIAYLLASCVVGLAISFTGWYCRSQVTATCYTVLGVANKMVTVLINLLIWDEHAGLARPSHHAPRTTHHAPRTTRHAPRTMHHAPRTRAPCTVHRVHAVTPPGGTPGMTPGI